MNKKFLKAFPIILLLPLVLLLPHPSFAENEDIQFLISKEVAPCLTSGGNPKNCDQYNPAELLVMNSAHNLRNDWVKYNFARCSTIPIRGNYISDNKVEYVFPSGEKYYSTTTLMDLSISEIIDTNSVGIPATTQGIINTNITSSMQDYSPKPISWFDLPHWSENSGSSMTGSRNALLFEFFDDNMNPVGINSFGAWFGDLETRSDSISAFTRVYDSAQNALTGNIIIPENIDTDLSQCGNTSGVGIGCGNHSTRWISFSHLSDSKIQKLLVAVGEDDLGADGSREHLSYTGPTLILSSVCPTPTLNSSVVPSPTITPSIIIPTFIPTNTILPSPTFTPTPLPTATNTPTPTYAPTLTPTSTLVPTFTVTPSALPTSAITPTVNIISTTAPTATISPTSTPQATFSPTPKPVHSVLKNPFCSQRYRQKLMEIKMPVLYKILLMFLSNLCTK